MGKQSSQKRELRPVSCGSDGIEEVSSKITPREREILGCATEGLTNRQIGERLGLAEVSVKDVMSRLIRRYGCNNRMQLIAHLGPQLPEPPNTSA